MQKILDDCIANLNDLVTARRERRDAQLRVKECELELAAAHAVIKELEADVEQRKQSMVERYGCDSCGKLEENPQCRECEEGERAGES